MKVRYVGPAARPVTVHTPDGQLLTDDAGVVDVPDDLAARLLDQDTWETGGGRATKGRKPRSGDQIAPEPSTPDGSDPDGHQAEED